MLTPLTQTAIFILHDIATGGIPENTSKYKLFINTVSELLRKLEIASLISCKDIENRELLSSYELIRPCHQISLLELLEATGEHLNCNHPTQEALYAHYRNAANKLGVINHMTRIYLSEIKLNDLF
ncbi:hypothetical protein [uncultured Bacteroides sp.]|uniref:hypothetical protein n=1 Tax=uncultured Bacteroides sp. TaxID=162156 RepID=UPI0025F8CC8C|nr:hypothetical protein [uncultured Bacteroides sp.]